MTPSEVASLMVNTYAGFLALGIFVYLSRVHR